MKKSIYLAALLILIFTISTKVVAQSKWAPAGATWHYGSKHTSSGNIYYHMVKSIGNIMVNSVACMQVEAQDYFYACEGVGGTFIMYEDSNRVFYFDEAYNQFFLFLDFNKNPGESWVIGPDMSLIIYVDSVSYINVNSYNLKVQYVWEKYSDGQISRDVITERIGFADVFFPRFILPWECDLLSLGLRCYSDPEIGFYETGIADSCTYTYNYVGINNKESEKCIVFPNPVKDKLIISIQDNTKSFSSLEIYNAIGKKVFNDIIKSDEITINTQKWKPGVYVLVLKGNSTIYRKKIIKQ